MELNVNELRRRCLEFELDLNARYGKNCLIKIDFQVSTHKGISPESFIDILFKAVTVASGVSAENMKSQVRMRQYVMARQVFFYVLKAYRADLSLKNIAKLLDKDHTTVLHSIKQAKAFIDVKDKDFMPLYKQVVDTISLTVTTDAATPTPNIQA